MQFYLELSLFALFWSPILLQSVIISALKGFWPSWEQGEREIHTAFKSIYECLEMIKLLAFQPLICLDSVCLLWLFIALHDTRSIPCRLSFELEISEEKSKSLIWGCSVLWGTGPELPQPFTRLLWRLLPTQGLTDFSHYLWKKPWPSPFSATSYHAAAFIVQNKQISIGRCSSSGAKVVDFGFLKKKPWGHKG